MHEIVTERTTNGSSKRPFVILFLLLGFITLGCVIYYLLNRGYITTDDAEIDGNIYTIAPQIAGRVEQVLVNDNQHVQAGQVLVLLDPRDEDVALAKAQANEQQALAQVIVAQANPAEAQANVEVAMATVFQAQQDFARYKAVNPNAVSEQQIDTATANIRVAKAKYDAAVSQVRAMQASTVAAEGELTASQVAVQDAKLKLTYTIITAPAAGHVSEKTVQPGTVVASGAGLMALVSDDVWVTANYKETQLGAIRVGSPATIAVDAIPGVTFKAHVDSIQYGTGSIFSLLPTENATGNYVKIVQRVPVKLMFDTDPTSRYLLAPGMSVLPSISSQK